MPRYVQLISEHPLLNEGRAFPPISSTNILLGDNFLHPTTMKWGLLRAVVATVPHKVIFLCSEVMKLTKAAESKSIHLDLDLNKFCSYKHTLRFRSTDSQIA